LALRQLEPVTEAELRRYESDAERDYAVIRRLSLPRNLLARLVEVAVVLDRANCLVEAGLSVRIARLVPRAVTPRNIAIFASFSEADLPALLA
jgi:hypothetical protein